MTENIRIAFCKYHTANSKLTQLQLLTWIHETHNVSAGQATVSKTLKRKAELLKLGMDANAYSTRHRSVKYPLTKSALAD